MTEEIVVDGGLLGGHVYFSMNTKLILKLASCCYSYSFFSCVDKISYNGGPPTRNLKGGQLFGIDGPRDVVYFLCFYW